MKNLEVTTHPEVKQIFNKYPDFVREKMEHLRKLILETASEIQEIDAIEETLKWGEPSYISKTGSTLRMDWKEK